MNFSRSINKQGSQFHCDGVLILAFVGILIIGYLMVSSASLHIGMKNAGNSLHYPFRQLAHIILGLLSLQMTLLIKLDFWERYGQWLFIIGLALLVLVLIPGFGVEVNGSVRWLSMMGVRIQVSEVVKLISVIYMAGYVTRHQQLVRKSVYGMVKPLSLFAFACLLLLLEPDFGSAVVILTIALAVMFLSGARLWQFVVLLASVVLLAILLIVISPYRWSRVTSFINPWADAQNTGFQLVQALISFGRGEWFGVGLGSGIQKLFYLPEAHTDFLFSVIGEEMGLVGVVVVIALFTIIIWRAFAIGVQAELAGQHFAAFLAYGVGILFGFQAFVNMGVNMGMLPTKGLTLPLMSYGGGSMIVMCTAMGILLHVYSDIHAISMATTPKRKREWANAS